jgi:DNA-binding CsgD family transcriptional regulator
MVGSHQPTIHPDFRAAELLEPVRRITPAELRVLQLVALGLTSREIAEALWVSRQAVTYHIGNLFMKLRADSRAGLVARAYAVGILSPGRWPPAVDAGYVLMAGLASRSPRFRGGVQPPRVSGASRTATRIEGRTSPVSMEAR